MPVAPVVVWVNTGKTELIHNVVVAPVVTVLSGVTVIVPVAENVPQPPINGIV